MWPACPRRKVQWALRTLPLCIVVVSSPTLYLWGDRTGRVDGTQLSQRTPTNVSPDETRPSRARAAPALALASKFEAGAVGPARPDIADEDCSPCWFGVRRSSSDPGARGIGSAAAPQSL